VIQTFKDVITDCVKDLRIRELETTVSKLERRIEELEQYSRRTCLSIANVPESSSENTDDIILDIAKDMKINLKREEISRSHRIPTRNKNKKVKDIVVRFTTYNKRRTFYDAKSKLKNSETHKNVYVNEHLTQQRKELSWICRKYVKGEKLMGTWTRDGRVAVKFTDRDGDEVVKWITHKSELDKVVTPDADPDADLNLSFMG